MKVKICGLTNLDDALTVAEAGADMLGFIFYPPSPRFIPINECTELMSGLRQRGISTPCVGVFVNNDTATITQVIEDCDLQFAQLHGDEPPADLDALGNQAYKAVRPRSLTEAINALRNYAGRSATTPSLLLDTYRSNSYGGTGERANWELAAELARRTPMLLAGGLTPANVISALTKVCPWGVDVSTGVELSPGIKDRKKVTDFVKTVREFVKVSGLC